MNTPRTTVLLTSTLAAMLLVPAGCESSQVATANDELRARVLELEKENTGLRQRATELQAELERESARPDSLPLAVRENTPRVSELSLGRLTHPMDTDDDGLPDRIVVYVNPKDGLGRFVQMVGMLTVHALHFPASSDAVTIGRLDLDPAAVRRAYRSSMTGTHYTIELPITVTAEQARESCLVRVRFEDGLTGAVHAAERDVRLRR